MMVACCTQQTWNDTKRFQGHFTLRAKASAGGARRACRVALASNTGTLIGFHWKRLGLSSNLKMSVYVNVVRRGKRRISIAGPYGVYHLRRVLRIEHQWYTPSSGALQAGFLCHSDHHLHLHRAAVRCRLLRRTLLSPCPGLPRLNDHVGSPRLRASRLPVAPPRAHRSSP